MSSSPAWRTTAAAVAFSLTVAGAAHAEDVPSSQYGFAPIATQSPVASLPPFSPAAATVDCQQPVDNGRPATWWERMHLRKWERKRRMQECFVGYPEEFCEQPLGVALYGQMDTQIANGAAAKLVLYNFDFVDGSPLLNPKGVERLSRHVEVMMRCPCPLVIEQTPETPGLAESRSLAVQRSIAQLQAPIASDRVIVGQPIPFGLSGRQAVILDANLLRDTRAGGTTNLAPGSFRAGGSIQGFSGGGGGGSYGSTGLGTSR